MLPRLAFHHQRNQALASTTEYDRRYWHTAGGFSLVRIRWALLHRYSKTRIGVCCLAFSRVIGVAMPINGRYLIVLAFPPWLIIAREADIGENGIFVQHCHCIRVGFFTG